MMRAHLLILFLAASIGAVRAQEPAQPAAQPIVETELEKSEVVPGQYTILRVTVLVPTWLPKPVEFPSMETPNLRVRLPERSTGPASRTIEGQQWSGVSRQYLISPMVADTFKIPAQTISVTYAVPGSSDAQASLSTRPVTITGIVPHGAEGLDPFIAAGDLKLTQQITQPTIGLQPGQSVKRTVTAQIDGASPIVLPRLMPDVRIEGIAVYPDEPSVSEKDERGQLSGTRTEALTLMAESGATGHVPEIELRWFNLQTGAVETAKVEGFDISVAGLPARQPLGRSKLVAAGIAAVIVLALLVLLIRRLLPRAMDARRRRRAGRLASKAWAERAMFEAVRRHDYPATLHALDEWASRSPVTDAARLAPAHQALTRIGRAIYGKTRDRPMPADWRDVRRSIEQAVIERRPSAGGELPPLNPEIARG